MNKSMFFFDTETSGLDPSRHTVLQLAYLIEVDSEIVIERAFDIKPPDDADLCLKALETNNFSIDRMMVAKDRVYVLELLRQDVKAAVGGKSALIPCGHHVRFDIDFLYALAKKGSETWWMNFGANDYLALRKHVCTHALAHYLDCKGVLNLPDYRLTTLTKYFNIPHDNAHDALADVRATRELYHKLDNLLTGQGEL